MYVSNALEQHKRGLAFPRLLSNYYANVYTSVHERKGGSQGYLLGGKKHIKTHTHCNDVTAARQPNVMCRDEDVSMIHQRAGRANSIMTHMTLSSGAALREKFTARVIIVLQRAVCCSSPLWQLNFSSRFLRFCCSYGRLYNQSV